MNLKALITMLVLGSSSVAMAEPVFKAKAQATWNFGYDRNPVVRDHRYDPRYTHEGRWTQPGYDYRYDNRYGERFQYDNVKLNSDSSEYIGPIFSARGYGWSALTEPTHIENSRQIIRVHGAFRGLMLESVRGSSFVKMVKVRFVDGRTQTIPVNRSLGRWGGIELPIARGEVEYIVVYGHSNAGSSYRVLGA